MKVELAKKKNRRNQILQFRKVKQRDEKSEQTRSLIQEYQDKQIKYRREASKLRQEEILEQRAEQEEKRKLQQYKIMEKHINMQRNLEGKSSMLYHF